MTNARQLNRVPPRSSGNDTCARASDSRRSSSFPRIPVVFPKKIAPLLYSQLDCFDNGQVSCFPGYERQADAFSRLG